MRDSIRKENRYYHLVNTLPRSVLDLPLAYMQFEDRSLIKIDADGVDLSPLSF